MAVTISGNGTVTGLNIGGGVKQVQFFEYGDRFSDGSGAWVATPLTATITPTSASNKILVTATVLGGSGNASVSMLWQIRKNDVEWAPSAGPQTLGSRNRAWNIYQNGDNNVTRTNTVQVMDSTITTSPITYTVYFKSQTASSSAVMNGSYSNADNFSYGHIGSSYITLMEISV
jgi:hypothetical protein